MTVPSLALSAVLLALAFWLRTAGTAVSRVPRADALRDASDEVAGARVVADLLDEREVVGQAVGVVASSLLIIASVLATAVLVRQQSAGSAIVTALAVGVVVFLVGDLIPRRLGRLRPKRTVYASSLLLRTSVALGGWAYDLLPDSDDDEVEDEEDPSSADEQERELIDSVLEFSETIVREVMTPRPDMVTIPVTASIETLIEISSNAGFSRFPVTSDDDVVGMVIVRDLLPVLSEESRPNTVAEVMRQVEFVPETKYASSLLAEMQDSHAHQVIVVDEYGDVVGLVTIEDLLEELVGEIADESDQEESLIVKTDSAWRVDARLPVDELEKETGVELPDEGWDTVGGLVLALAERVPEEGEIFAIDELVLQVTRMQGRRVSTVLVTLSGQLEPT